MIGHLKGTVSFTGTGYVLIDVRGVGYKVRVSQNTLATLHHETETSLFTHLAVRENALDLYGFSTRAELEFFEMLISVSGIGPKTALAILSLASADTLKRAIAGGDAAYLTKVSGIGKKNAGKIVVELKDKLGGADAAARILIGADAEALEALEALGYSMRDARESVAKAKGETAQEKIRDALRTLGSHKK
ncbi:MAG: Holliday junction branch migration protein RuvA [Patescibacteria group bacterium]